MMTRKFLRGKEVPGCKSFLEINVEKSLMYVNCKVADYVCKIGEDIQRRRSLTVIFCILNAFLCIVRVYCC